MKAAVIVFPGSNCDRDALVTLQKTPGVEPFMVWHKQADFDKADLIVLPGGFSFGDYLRCGAMAAQSPVMKEVVARAKAGVPTLGICNGFQVLCEAGLLPGVVMRNATLKFVCRDVDLKVENSQTLFTSRYAQAQVVRIPVAHHDGNYFIDPEGLQALKDRDQIAFRYVTPEGERRPEANPNGSLEDIAGIFNEEKTVLGLMPHPERLADAQLGGTDGQGLFNSLAEALA
jgi:phosphoribosylformylglycinamidine synthase